MLAPAATLLTAWITVVSASFDSQGTSFQTLFIWNNGADRMDATPSISVLNANQQPISVTFKWNKITVTRITVEVTPKAETVSVPANSFYTKTFSYNVVWEYQSSSVQRGPDSRIFIDSTQPVSVFAHNYVANGTGDSYAVLPTTMADKRYVLTLPSPDNRGHALACFLPAGQDGEIKLTTVTDLVKNEYTVPLKAAQGSDVYCYGGVPKSFSFSAIGTVPFLVVTAVRHMTVASFDEADRHDFGSYMPTPALETGCRPNDDRHIAELFTSKKFIVTPPYEYCSEVPLSVLSSSAVASSYTLFPMQYNSPITWDRGSLGDAVVTHTQAALVQVTRVGGVDLIPLRGTYLDMVPSVSQYVTGTTPFIIRSSDEKITIISDTKTGSVDGSKTLRFKLIEYYDTSYFYAVCSGLSVGMHTFTTTGSYTLSVYGSTDYHAFSFTASLNRQKLIPPSTITSTTGSSSTANSPPVGSSSTTPSSAISSSGVTTSGQSTTLSSSSTTSTTSIPGGISSTPAATTTKKAGLATPQLSLGALCALLVLARQC